MIRGCTLWDYEVAWYQYFLHYRFSVPYFRLWSPCKASPKHTIKRVHSLSWSQREPEEELWNNMKSKAGRMWQEEDTRYLCTQWNQSKHLTFLLQPPFLLVKKINSCNSWPALTSHRCWLATVQVIEEAKKLKEDMFPLWIIRQGAFFNRWAHIKINNNTSKDDIDGRRQESSSELWRTRKAGRRSSNPPCWQAVGERVLSTSHTSV